MTDMDILGSWGKNLDFQHFYSDLVVEKVRKQCLVETERQRLHYASATLPFPR
jgi:hypothetical protein